MKQLANIVLSTTLLFLACTGSALAEQIKIDPNGYTGEWTVDYGRPQTGAAVVELGEPDKTTGAHVISLGGAELLFDIAADGTVVPRNKEAAAARGSTLRFMTTTIVVDPVHFTGQWRIVEGATSELKGMRRVTLVRGLQFYGLEVGATGSFDFDVAADGTVHVRNALAATRGSQLLTLANTAERFRE